MSSTNLVDLAIKVKALQDAHRQYVHEAYSLGSCAFLCGQMREDNPFQPLEAFDLCYAWHDGYHDVERWLEGCRAADQMDCVQEAYETFGLKYQPGYVYVLSSGETSYFKIGRTIHLDKRLTQLATVPPFAYDVGHLFAADNYCAAEEALHKEFAAKRVRGEWFSLNTKDMMWIKGIKSHKYGRFYFDPGFLRRKRFTESMYPNVVQY